MREIVTTARLDKGRLQMRNRKTVLAQVARMKDGEFVITFTPRRASRSLQANRYYWGVVVELLAEHTGYTPDEIHEVLKAKFLPKKLAVTDANGEIQGEFVIGGSTTKLNTLEFGEFIEAIRQWAAESLGVVIPDPDTGQLWAGARPQRRTA